MGRKMVVGFILISIVVLCCSFSLTFGQSNEELLTTTTDKVSINSEGEEAVVDVEIYGVPCDQEPEALRENITQWVIDNVDVEKPENSVVYLGQIIHYAAEPLYENGNWQGVKTTRVRISESIKK